MNKSANESPFPGVSSLCLLHSPCNAGKAALGPTLAVLFPAALWEDRYVCPTPVSLVGMEPSRRTLSLSMLTSHGGSWFYWSEAFLVSLTRENLEFLDPQGHWGQLSSEENRYPSSTRCLALQGKVGVAATSLSPWGIRGASTPPRKTWGQFPHPLQLPFCSQSVR